MNRWLLILLIILCCFISHAQPGYLFVKKGYKKRKIYMEGEHILFRTNDGSTYNGFISLLRNDSIWINGQPVRRMDITTVFLDIKSKKSFHLEPENALLIAAGMAITTAGLTISKQAGLKEALTAALVIGGAPLALRYAGSKISLKRKKFRIGKKFRLQVLEFHMPGSKPF